MPSEDDEAAGDVPAELLLSEDAPVPEGLLPSAVFPVSAAAVLPAAGFSVCPWEADGLSCTPEASFLPFAAHPVRTEAVRMQRAAVSRMLVICFLS